MKNGTVTKRDQNGAVAPAATGEDIKSLLLAAEDRFKEVAPKWLSVERVVRLVLAARSRNPKIGQCSKESILLFTMKCSETGLEPIGAGGAWAVPYYNNKNSTMELQFIPDWRGLIQLAKRTEQVKHVHAHLVHENDRFDYQLGDTPSITHHPALKERGEVVGAYAIAVLPDDSRHVEFMTKSEVEDIRQRSKASDNGPWKTDWGQMAIKTVVRRALKVFAASPEMQAALEADNAATGLKVRDLEPIRAPRAIQAPKAKEDPAPPLSEPLPISHPDAVPPEDIGGGIPGEATEE